MNTENVRRDLEKLVNVVYDGREHIAGGLGEAERLRGIIEDYFKGQARLIEIPVYSWHNRYLRLEGIEGDYTIAPYVLSAELDSVRLVRIEGDPSSPDTWIRYKGEDGIAVIGEPEDPDDLKASVLLAAETGFPGVLVFAGRLRKIVTTGTWNYSFGLGAPTPIPIVYVENPRILGDRISLYVDSVVMASKGYILEWDSEGSDDLIMVGAHYDRWFTGFQDDMLGVAQAIMLARLLSQSGKRVKLVLFTAEEHGAPGYAGWYWSWGSRFYSRQLSESGISDHVSLYINFDLAGSSELLVSGTGSYTCHVRNYVRERCCECPECDSIQLAMAGIPTLSFHSLWGSKTLNIYHTREDIPENADLRYAVKAIELAYKAALSTPRWEYVRHELAQLSRNIPLEGRRVLYKLTSIALRVGWERLYRELAAKTLRPVHYGSYRYDSVRLEAMMMPEVTVLPKLMRDLRKGDPPHEIWVSGEERLLYVVKAKNGESCGLSCIMDQAKFNINILDDVVDSIYVKLIK